MPFPDGTQYKREFAARQTRQALLTLVFFIPLVGLGIAKVRSAGALDELMGVPIRTWVIGYFALVLVAAILMNRNWRCPACGAPLTRKFNHPCCSHCGTRLQ